MGRNYPVKKGTKLSTEYILAKARETAQNVKVSGDHVMCTIPGIKSIDMLIDGKELMVETVNDEKPQDPLETVRVYNRLIENITGLSSKERKKKMSKI